MKTMLILTASMYLLSATLRANEPVPNITITGELDAIVASRAFPDPVHVERLKQFDRAAVTAEIRARVLLPQNVPTNDMEGFRRNHERANLYRALAAITEQEPGENRWFNATLVETLHYGATEENEYVRGHVLESLDVFRHDMPQEFRDANIQALSSSTYWIVSGRLGSLAALIPREGFLAKDLFWGFAFDPDLAHPALWANVLTDTSRFSDPEETIFLTLRLNAADCLIRHCDLSEVVAAWQQATDMLGKRALGLAVFRKLWQPDAAFHSASPEVQREAVRLASEGLNNIHASLVSQSGFLITIDTAFEQGAVQSEVVRTDLRAFLVNFKAQPAYAEFGDYIQSMLDRMGN